MSGTETKPVHFRFPQPRDGITRFDVTVEAKSNEEAVEKLFAYIFSIIDKQYPVPQPLGDSSDPAKVGQECIRRLRLLRDPVAFVLTLHLFCEHWLNQILLKFCPAEDLTNFQYARKLQIVYAIEKIPKMLFENLKELNRLRNKVAHNLDFDFTKMDLNYHPSHPDFKASGYKPSYDPESRQHHIGNVLGIVMADTYGQLHKHCFEVLGFRVSPPKAQNSTTPESTAS